MKPAKVRSDDSEQKALSCLNQEENEWQYSGWTPSKTSEIALAGALGTEKLSREEREFIAKLPASLQEFCVMPSGCWEWQGPTHRKEKHRAYPVCSRSGKWAHREMLRIAKGLPDGLFACHHCDNPPCVNPAHLFAGTQLDNMRDCISKGRHVCQRPRGQRNSGGRHADPNSTRALAKKRAQENRAAEQARDAEILRLHQQGLKQHEIGRLVGMGQPGVGRAIKRLSAGGSRNGR